MATERSRRRGRSARWTLPFADWTPADKNAWRAGFPESAIKRARQRQEAIQRRPRQRRPANTPMHLAPASIANRRAALERYFGFLTRRHPQVMARPLAARFTRALIEGFRHDFGAKVKPQSIKDYLDWLRLALENLASAVDGEILRAIALAIPDRTHKSRKPPPLVHATTLLRSACAEMDRLMPQILALTRQPSGRDAERAPRLLYRNALMIAVGVADPLRAKNSVGLTLGETLKIIAGVGFEIAIPREQMKTRNKPHRRKLPQSLNRYVQFYLDHVWPPLRGEPSENACALWLTWRGERVGMSTHHAIVKRTTRRLVGEKLGPQSLRMLIADLVVRLGLPLAMAKRGLDHAPNSPVTERSYTSTKRLAGLKLLGRLTAAEFARAGLRRRQ